MRELLVRVDAEFKKRNGGNATTTVYDESIEGDVATFLVLPANPRPLRGAQNS